jgi:hypothetical protein
MYESDRTGGPSWEFGVAGAFETLSQRETISGKTPEIMAEAKEHASDGKRCHRECCHFTTEEAMSALRLRSVLDNKAA